MNRRGREKLKEFLKIIEFLNQHSLMVIVSREGIPDGKTFYCGQEDVFIQSPGR